MSRRRRIRRSIFLASVMVVFWAVHVVVYATVARAFQIDVPGWPIWCLAVAFLFVVASRLVRRWSRGWSRTFYRVMAIWLGTVFLLFSASLVYQAYVFLAGQESYELLMALFGAALLAAVYAVWNARRIEVRHVEVPIVGLGRSVRVAHLSDIHVGTVNQRRYLERVVAMTNQEKPDLVLMTGDLFDGSVPIDKNILSALNDFAAPSYFTHGNHELYEGLHRVRETLSGMAIQILENQLITWGELQIVGVNDRQALTKEQSVGTVLDELDYDRTRPTVLMYHSPVEWDEAHERGVDLMLSGHTHFGQIMPFTLMVRLSYSYLKGLYTHGRQHLYVTPGTGTWGPPMRLGSSNQIAILTLVPAEVD